MIGKLRTMANSLAYRWMRRRSHVTLGPRSRVDWINARVASGSTLIVGEDCLLNARFTFDSPSGTIRIGDRCFIGRSQLVCHSAITLGDDVVISWGVTIVDHDSHSLVWDERRRDVLDWMAGRKDWSHVTIAPVSIGDRVWIGFNAIVLKGITVGDGAVIGAGAVVTRDVSPYTLVAGNPAKVIKQLAHDAGQ